MPRVVQRDGKVVDVSKRLLLIVQDGSKVYGCFVSA